MALAALWMACACSPVKHVPEGQYLLDNADIVITQTPDSIGGHRDEEVRSAELVNYLRQAPRDGTTAGCAGSDSLR